MFIYLIVNHETGKYYVGQHKGKNLKAYLQRKFSAAKRNEGRGGSYLFASMRKHPFPSLWSIHALRSNIQTREELDEVERDFIKFLRSQDPEYGYNICRGGEGFTGPHTEDTKFKMSIRSKRMWSESEFRVKRAQSLKEAMSKPEYRTKVGIASKNNWVNPEFRFKTIEANKRAQSDPVVRAKVIEANKRMWLNPQFHLKMSRIHKALYTNPEHRAKHTKSMQSPETRLKLSEAAKKQWVLKRAMK